MDESINQSLKQTRENSHNKSTRHTQKQVRALYSSLRKSIKKSKKDYTIEKPLHAVNSNSKQQISRLNKQINRQSTDQKKKNQKKKSKTQPTRHKNANSTSFSGQVSFRKAPSPDMTSSKGSNSGFRSLSRYKMNKRTKI